MSPKDADGKANSVDPDQTAPLGAVWSGSTLFAQTCLSEKLGSSLQIRIIRCPLKGKWTSTKCEIEDTALY